MITNCRKTAKFLALTALTVSLLTFAVGTGEVGVHAAGVLPFDMPAASTLHASAKKVFANYHTQFVVSQDNAPDASDYYTTQYLSPTGEGGRYASFGGFLRDRPMPRPVDPSVAWQLDDMKLEVQRATAAGIDGFTVDMFTLSGYHYSRFQLLLQAAAAVDPNFKIMLMPDSNGDIVSDPNALAAAYAGLASNPAIDKLDDGRLVVSPFFPERLGAAWWQNWLNIMQNQYGIGVAFVPVFLDYTANVDAFAPFSYGFSTWGNRSPASVQWTNSSLADAHARGKLWMHPVALQDARPYSGVYDEAGNSETLRKSFSDAISGGADWVQLLTWNDYSENSQLAPSTHVGWVPLDLISGYTSQFKTGTFPQIVRDTLYLSHRSQFANSQPSGGQTYLMSLRGGSTPARDTVEVLSFLTAPAMIDVTVGGVVTTYAAPAGQFARTLPLQAGTVSARIAYANGSSLTVTSPWVVTSSPVVQDMTYQFVSSGRNGVFVAVPAGAGPTVPATTLPPATTTTTTPPPTTVAPTTVAPTTVASTTTVKPTTTKPRRRHR